MEPVSTSIAPEVEYIVHNIYCEFDCTFVGSLTSSGAFTHLSDVNNFFSSWYDALDGASISALSIAQSVINELDPAQNSHFALDDLLLALTVGLAFFGAPEASSAISVAVTSASAVLFRGLQQAPTVARAIWPSGTTDTKSIQLGKVDTALSEASSNFTFGVQNAITKVMSDVPSFIDFAQYGNFSGQDEVSLPNDTATLGLALNTFILSTAMSANQWHATPFTSVTREDIESNVPGSGGFDCTFGANNICTNSDHSINVFYSDTTETAYALSTLGADPDLDPFTLMNDIVNNTWSTLEALFDGAFNCTLAGGTGQPLNFFPNNTLDFSCISQLPMCSCGDPCPIDPIDGVCPFPTCEC